MTSRVHRTQSVSAVFYPFVYHLPSVTSTRKMNAFSNETCLNFKYQPFIFQHIVQIYLNTYWYTPVRPYERRDCCDRWISRWNNTSAMSFFINKSTTLSRPQANFLHQTCIAGLVKHLSPYTRDLRIVFFAFESNLKSNRSSDSISNRIFESNRSYIPRKP